MVVLVSGRVVLEGMFPIAWLDHRGQWRLRVASGFGASHVAMQAVRGQSGASGEIVRLEVVSDMTRLLTSTAACHRYHKRLAGLLPDDPSGRLVTLTG
jgi:hypothetical protein